MPDRARISADGEDLSVVVAHIVDSQGRVVPTAADEVTFTVGGPGRVIGVGNGDPSSHEPDRASKRRSFNGLCMALVQSQKTPGEIRVDASAPGLASATADPDSLRDDAATDAIRCELDAHRCWRGPRGLLPEARHRRGPPS